MTAKGDGEDSGREITTPTPKYGGSSPKIFPAMARLS
jgi:hypothetical protein